MRISLVPDRVFASYRQITPELLRQRNIRLLLCDLDFTLAPKSVADADENVRAWLNALQASGVEVMILSNNRNPSRVERFCRDLGIGYVGHAQKPRQTGYRRALALAGVSSEQVAMLGDKLLTDVLGANVCGAWALMVEPLGGAKTAWQKVLHAMQRPFKALSREGRV